MQAFVDESIRRHPTGLYVVAAAVIGTPDLDDARHEARKLLSGRQHRFHWWPESEERRLQMLGLTRSVGVKVLAAYSSVPSKRSERARALCLERLLWDFAQLGIAEAVLESREDHNDVKDRRCIINAQKNGTVSLELSYRFERPNNEPLLWFADSAASAVASSLVGEGRAYLEALGDSLTIVCAERA